MIAKGTFEVTMKGERLTTSSTASHSCAYTSTSVRGGARRDEHVEMTAARTAVETSAGYVAIERVTGVLDGKRGTFVLQHSGTMTRGTRSLTVTVVPDSGTGELAGIAGRMDIQIVDGKHFYELDFDVAP